MILVSNLSITYFLGIRYIKSVSKMKPYRFAIIRLSSLIQTTERAKNRSLISYN